MKKIFAGALAAAFFCVPAFAHPPVTVLVDGRELAFDQPPIIQDDRVLVPMRMIFQTLGAEVLWEESTQTVTALTMEDTLQFRIGDAGLYKNGQLAYTMDVPAQIVNERTLVPIRAIAESFGAVVGWEEAGYTVTIQSQGQTGTQAAQPGQSAGVQDIQGEPKPGGFAAEIQAEDGTVVLTVKLECDILQGKNAVQEGINTQMAEAAFAEGQGFLRQYREAALRDYAAHPEDFQPYYCIGSYHLERETAGYASFLASTASYTGITEKEQYFSHTYSLSTGKEVYLEDLVPDNRTQLESLWRAGFLAMVQEKPDAFYKDAETRLGQVLDKVGFYLTEDGIAFYLPPESIAPAAAGLPAFEVRYTF